MNSTVFFCSHWMYIKILEYSRKFFSFHCFFWFLEIQWVICFKVKYCCILPRATTIALVLLFAKTQNICLLYISYLRECIFTLPPSPPHTKPFWIKNSFGRHDKLSFLIWLHFSKQHLLYQIINLAIFVNLNL